MLQKAPLQYNEVICLLILLWAVVFFVAKRDQLRSIPNMWVLFASLSILFLGYIFTILEGYYLADLFNQIEHFLHMASALLLIIWVVLLQTEIRGGKRG